MKAIADLFEGLGPNNTEKPSSQQGKKGKKEEKKIVQYDIPKNICFDFLAQESGWTKKKFDSALIEDVFNKTEELKTTFDEVSMLTI